MYLKFEFACGLVVLILKVAVIDGLGGGIGKNLIEKINKVAPDKFELIALGTNSLATSAMIKAGADLGATGENPIVINSERVDVIMGPLAIVIPNSIMGEITPKMAYAIGNSPALKILIPINKCNVEIAGTENKNINELLDSAVNELLAHYNAMKA